jgi:hypothetical protein
MKEKIFSSLKSAIVDPKSGKTSISDKTLNAYVEIIAAQIGEDETKIADAINPYVVTLKEVEANINSVAAEAAKAAKPKTKPAKEETKVETPENDDTPAWAKSLLEKVVTLESTVTSFGAEKTQQTMAQRLTSALKEKKVPDWYSNDILEGRTFKDETEVTDWTEKVATKWATRNQELANQGFKETAAPGSGDLQIKDAELIAATINAGTKQIIEQTKK